MNTDPASLFENQNPNSKDVNIGNPERIYSILGGVTLAIYGMGKRSLLGWIAGMVGAMLIRRGIRGRCELYDQFKINTSNNQKSLNE